MEAAEEVEAAAPAAPQAADEAAPAAPQAVEEATPVAPQAADEAGSTTAAAATAPEIQAEEAAAAEPPVAPEAAEAAEAEGTAEAAEGFPSSVAVEEGEPPPPPPPPEGEAEAAPVGAEEPPASEEPAVGDAPSAASGPSEGPGAEGASAVPPAASDQEAVLAATPSFRLSADEEELLPTHVSFAKGELLEPPPLQVGVDLGRRVSLSLWELELRKPSSSSLALGSSPESVDSAVVAAETEEELAWRLAQEQLRREELMEQYRQMLSDRGRLRHYNAKLQSKLGELLNKAKGKEPARAQLEQHISDREQRYSRYLAMLQEMRRDQMGEMAWFQKQIEALQRSCEEKLAKVDAEWKAHQAVKKEVAVYTMGRRLGGRHAAIKEVDQIQAREQSKEKEVTEVRLENIKLKHRIQKLEGSLKVQEMLAEGLHLIDFEQLKIENQTYNEKIEERNEELLKLRRRITNTVQILSQIKEKLQFVEAKNQEQKAELMAIEAHVAQKREMLTKTKQARDKLRIDNQKLQQKCGLLGNTLLLRDYENKVSIAEEVSGKLDQLKQRHAVLTLACKGVKKKIKGAKSFLQL